MIEYRAIEKGDSDDWLVMRNQMWPDEILRNEMEVSDYFSERNIALECVLVAVNESAQLIGFIELNLRPVAHGSKAFQVPYVEGWYVTELYRNQKVGRSLMMKAESWAKNLGYNELASDSDKGNLKSLQQHKKLGFHVAGETVHFIKPLD